MFRLCVVFPKLRVRNAIFHHKFKNTPNIAVTSKTTVHNDNDNFSGEHCTSTIGQ